MRPCQQEERQRVRYREHIERTEVAPGATSAHKAAAGVYACECVRMNARFVFNTIFGRCQKDSC
jgi:hypothetical protein